MEGDVQSQSAPAASEAPLAGTAEQATDAGVSTGTTTEATTPVGTDGDASSTAAAEAATSEASSSETSEQRASRRERQREARKQAAPAPAPEPAKTPAQIIAEHEATQRATREAQQRQYQEAMRYARYVGDDPAEPNNPQSQTKYQQTYALATTEIPDGDDQFYTDETRSLVKKVNAARAQIREWDGRRGMLQDVRTPAEQHARVEARTWLGNEIEGGLADLGLSPQEIIAQITDPQQAIRSIVKTLGERVRSAVTAELQPKIDDLEDDLAAEKSENDALRRQLGGAAPQALRGGQSALSGGGPLTYERYASMTSDDRTRLRSTPEGRAQIDAMTQGRSGAA